jgi:hypothetical protein
MIADRLVFHGTLEKLDSTLSGFLAGMAPSLAMLGVKRVAQPNAGR